MGTGTINTVEDFAEVMKLALEERHPECKIIVHKVTKNNGLVLTGLLVKNCTSNLSPTIYVDGAYGEYRCGRDIAEIMDALDKVYMDNMVEADFDVRKIMDYGCVQDRICYKLVNKAKNKELLEDAPYIPFLDLAIVFYVLVSDDASGVASVTVRNHLLDIWGNPIAEELYRIAKHNTMKHFKGFVTNMMDVLSSMMASADDGCFFDMDSIYEDNAFPMYICSNRQKLNGAGTFLYDGLLKKFAAKLGTDIIILPSSIHETILLPDNGEMDTDYLISMVKEINRTEVSEEEVLSDSVYKYLADEDRIVMM